MAVGHLFLVPPKSARILPSTHAVAFFLSCHHDLFVSYWLFFLGKESHRGGSSSRMNQVAMGRQTPKCSGSKMMATSSLLKPWPKSLDSCDTEHDHCYDSSCHDLNSMNILTYMLPIMRASRTRRDQLILLSTRRRLIGAMMEMARQAS
jgi:hypothetical protein